MHIKHMHEMIEDLAECTLQAFKNDEDHVGNVAIDDAIEMLEKLNKAEYYAHIVKAMKEAKEEEEEEEKYLLRMFKEENKDEYKRMREQYGEEDGERRFYDDWRYKSTGRYSPKGRGSYDPSRVRSRRGYAEMMPMYDMMPEIYRDDAEWNRDMDRPMGRMYFTAGTYDANYGNNGVNSGNRYDGDGRRSNSGGGRDYREGRSGQRRRGYMESKELHSDNSPESKQQRMKELDAYMKDLSEDVTEMIGDASAEERALLKQKMQGLVSKL